MSDVDKLRVMGQAAKLGWGSITAGWPDLLLFKWDHERDELVEALFVECKRTRGNSFSRHLNDDQHLVLTVLKTLGLKVFICYNGDLRNLVEFEPHKSQIVKYIPTPNGNSTGQ